MNPPLHPARPDDAREVSSARRQTGQRLALGPRDAGAVQRLALEGDRAARACTRRRTRRERLGRRAAVVRRRARQRGARAVGRRLAHARQRAVAEGKAAARAVALPRARRDGFSRRRPRSTGSAGSAAEVRWRASQRFAVGASTTGAGEVLTAVRETARRARRKPAARGQRFRRRATMLREGHGAQRHHCQHETSHSCSPFRGLPAFEDRDRRGRESVRLVTPGAGAVEAAGQSRGGGAGASP